MSQNGAVYNDDNEAIPLQPVSKATRPKRINGNHVVHILSEETNPDLQDLGLSNVFKPIMYSSMDFGLTWKRPTSKWCDIHTVHSCLLLLVLWAQTVAYFPAYSREDKYGTLLFQKVIAHIWIGQITVGTSVYLYSKYKNIPSFLRQWENYKIKYGGLTLSFMKQHVFRRIVRINIAATTFMLVSGLIWIIARPTLYIKWLFPFTKHARTNGVHLGLLVFFTFMLCYTILVWLQCTLNTLCYCSLLKFEFEELVHQFSDTVHQNSVTRRSVANITTSDAPTCNNDTTMSHKSTTHKNECEHFRTRYVSLCKLVLKMDDVLNGFLLALYLFSIPMVILLLYCVTDKATYETDALSALLGFNSLVMSIILLICITGAGNSLAVAVSSNTIHFDSAFSLM